MDLKKNLNDSDNTRVMAWYYDSEIDKGISIGSYRKCETNAKALASIGIHNNEKVLTINRELAEKLGFKILIV